MYSDVFMETEMSRMYVFTRLLLIATILGACATQSEIMVEQGYPQSYADGFEDGCHSGNQAGGSMFDQFRKDINRFNSDTQYAQGWSDAFRQCETKMEAALRQQRMALEYQSLDDQRRDELDAAAHDALRNIDTSDFEALENN